MSEAVSNKVLELDFNEVFAGINNYIKYAAKNVASSSNMDGSLSAEDLYQEGVLLLVQCYNKYKQKEQQEFNALFKASLWRHIRKKANRVSIITVDIEEAYDLGYTEDNVEKMFMEYGMKQLMELLCEEPVAMAILKELIEPSPRTLWEMKMDTARKETLRAQGKKVNVPQNNKVKMLHIKRSLGITQKHFDLGILKVREVASKVFGEDCMELEY